MYCMAAHGETPSTAKIIYICNGKLQSRNVRVVGSLRDIKTNHILFLNRSIEQMVTLYILHAVSA